MAVHLLAAEPGLQPWAPATLRRAAAVALTRAAPEPAVAFLRRALTEPLSEWERAEVLADLGGAEALMLDLQAVRHLRQALELTPDPVSYARRTLALGQVLVQSDRGSEAIEAIDNALDRLRGHDSELALRLEAETLAAAHNSVSCYSLLSGRIERLDPDLPGRTPGERALLALVATQALVSGEPAERLAELAEGALGGGRLLAESGDAQPFYMAANVLVLSERLDRAQECLTDALGDARSRGSVTAFAMACVARHRLLPAGRVDRRGGRRADRARGRRRPRRATRSGRACGAARRADRPWPARHRPGCAASPRSRPQG